jgi:probable rRNA maturation factor
VPALPDLVIADRQRAVPYDHDLLSTIVRAALPDCLAVAGKLGGPLAGLRTIECSVVGSRTMAKIHREFLNERGVTDVITFPYGEIVVCATVAAARAPEFGHPVTVELALYCIHGLLHLAGHDDIQPADAARMRREQEKILKSVTNRC